MRKKIILLHIRHRQTQNQEINMNTAACRIMIVEDDLPLLYSLAFTLKRFEYKVAVNSNGTAALNEMVAAQQSSTPFHLLITDMQLPGLSGIELIDALSSRSIAVPTLVITAFCRQDLIAQLNTRGIRDMLIKPFNIRELAHRVSTILKKHSDDCKGASA
jgi:DNA-binding response OmpR family regulator